MKKIIVTGGSGFIGTNFVKNLAKKNYILYNIDKLSSVSTPERFKNKKSFKNYNFYKLDLLNFKKIKKLIFNIKPDFIINFAAESHVDRSIEDPIFFLKNNFISSINLFSIFKDYSKKNKNSRLIHISTDEVFGSNNSIPSKENYPYKPSSPYSSSKASADLVALSFNETYSTNIVIVNLCNNYGPYQNLEKFIPTCIFSLIRNKTIPIYGKGLNIREWIYVDDACRAILKLLKLKLDNSRFNIGSNARVDNFTIAKKIFSILKSKNKTKLKNNNYYKFVKDRPGHDLRYALNSSRFYKKSNFKIKNKIDKGLSKTIGWYLNNKKWVKYMKNKYRSKRIGLHD